MKPLEEVKRCLKRCSSAQVDCPSECGYHGGKIGHNGEINAYLCTEALAADALAYIVQLEERIALMLIQMRGDCGCCKHRKQFYRINGFCDNCIKSSGIEINHPLWEYEGLLEIKK